MNELELLTDIRQLLLFLVCIVVLVLVWIIAKIMYKFFGMFF